MLILHLSDIHFRAPQCNTDYDPNRSYRTRMVQSVREFTATLGPVDVILVSGDIAYCADPSEYRAALAWLNELAKDCRCPRECIYVVPGNHDVDRGIIAQKRSIQNAQEQIRVIAPAKRQGEVQAQFRDPAVGKALLEPLSAYNDFAKEFNCQVYASERMFWRQELPLGGGVTLRLYGLTSTLLSGAVTNPNQNDVKGSLYLSPWQTAIDPADNVVNLVMAHHPPDWLMDHEAVDDAINGGAALHLFGHKHRLRAARETHQYMRLQAGALNPDVNEPGWQPAYNLIKLNVTGGGAERCLDIEAYLMEFQSNPDRYRHKQDHDGSDIWCHRVRIPGSSVPAPVQAAGLEPQIVAPAEAPAPPKVDAEVVMSEQSSRRLVLSWWQLPMHARREIALKLDLISEDEIALPEAERYGRALMRAGERGMLEQLGEEIATWQK
jgi:predicted MPP superfamily phosphohydrolase